MNEALAIGGSDTLAAAIRAGERRALARAITLVESTHSEDRRRADELMATLLPATGGSIRVGITGVPGVGKSSFIETFGLHLIEAGHRIAVLAVDPSSRRSGGSILGDKTRMEELSRHPSAFIRPSPAGRTLGGVARRSREAMLLCETAGFDVILVETVGVGQSETAVADLVDLFLLLLLPAGGDELQGIKRGVMELADLVLVTKADGELSDAAGRAAAEYRSALHLLRPPGGSWTPEVLTCSAHKGRGIAEVWQAVGRFRDHATADGSFTERRSGQARAWMWSEIEESLKAALFEDPRVARLVAELEPEVTASRLAPGAAARKILAAFRDGTGTPG